VDRRLFLSILAPGLLLAAPFAADAQPAGKMWRIGFLGPPTSGWGGHLVQAFQQELRERGYVDGQNTTIVKTVRCGPRRSRAKG
jgi:hypothetical protein